VKSSELRTAFLEFFREKEHLIIPSASLVPVNDPTLLLINAGMAPLKPYFLDPGKAPSSRMASVQKCLRTKDIDEVGTTPRHLTFFEMLGNFSFGDYFKEEIIPWAWEFVTKDLKLPIERLSVSVFEKDDEAYNIWHKKVELPESKIFRLGENDNFWYMADTGPCGPDSEIFYDIGEEVGCGRPSCQPGCDCSRFTEIWNLVFTQFNRQQNGELAPLPKKNVDTGMGLERTVAAINNKISVFEIDLFQPLIAYIHEKSGFKGETETKGKIKFNPYFLMSDHLRGAAFLIADGVYPGNEGRGYILRRIMRRAFLHAQRNNLKQGDLINGLKFVYETLGDAYPEIINKSNLVEKILEREEDGFLSTLSHGESLLEKEIEKLERDGRKTLDGEIAFVLYDTYGFPLELTKDILREKGFTVDEEGFNRELEKQRERSRADIFSKFSNQNKDSAAQYGLPPTRFIGYEYTNTRVKIAGIYPNESWPQEEIEKWPYGEKKAIVLLKTPFYAEAGGQVGDKGIIKGEDFEFEVQDVKKDDYDVFLHLGVFKKGSMDSIYEIMENNTEVNAEVTDSFRRGIMRAHSATHLLHAALRETLGDHVKQAGSLVEDDRFRFDFSHFEPVNFDNLQKITARVNEWITQGLDVKVETMNYSDAVKAGAMAIFGEKYGETVRVVKMGDISMELCGGTHLDDTSRIGSFIITREESIASGTRRIEALTGLKATEHILGNEKILKGLSMRLAVGNEKLEATVDRIFDERKSLEKELEKFRVDIARSQASSLIEQAEKIGGISIITHKANGFDNNGLVNMVDGFKGKIDSYAALLIGQNPDKLAVVIAFSDDLVKRGLKAGEIIREICGILGGSGGGRSNIAQGGGKDASRINEAIEKFKYMIKEKAV